MKEHTGAGVYGNTVVDLLVKAATAIIDCISKEIFRAPTFIFKEKAETRSFREMAMGIEYWCYGEIDFQFISKSF